PGVQRSRIAWFAVVDALWLAVERLESLPKSRVPIVPACPLVPRPSTLHPGTIDAVTSKLALVSARARSGDKAPPPHRTTSARAAVQWPALWGGIRTKGKRAGIGQSG